MHHVRHAVHASKEPLAKLARLRIHVPVPRIRHLHPLRRFQAQAVHVADRHDQANQCLVLRQPEIVGRLDRIDGVPATVGQRHHAGFRRLRLQHEGRKVGCIQRMLDAAADRSTRGANDVRGGALQRLAEGVVRRKEIPALEALPDHCLARHVGQRKSVIDVMHHIRRALFIGVTQVGTAGHQYHALLFRRDSRHG
ncbi:hypothetical protein D3C72_1066080 [compost metagenome]